MKTTYSIVRLVQLGVVHLVFVLIFGRNFLQIGIVHLDFVFDQKPEQLGHDHLVAAFDLLLHFADFVQIHFADFVVFS